MVINIVKQCTSNALLHNIYHRYVLFCYDFFAVFWSSLQMIIFLVQAQTEQSKGPGSWQK